MSTEKHITGTKTCNKILQRCDSVNRIKLILERFNTIIHTKHSKSDSELQQQTHHLVTNLLIDSNYSNVQLLNDFYHSKYQHNTNDNRNAFHEFYTFLINDNMLKCDIDDCKSAHRYYNRRNISFPTEINNEADSNCVSLNLMCRIHTYFIHSFENNGLKPDEIQYIEKQLNDSKLENDDMENDRKLEIITSVITKNHSSQNSKYMTLSDDHTLKCKDISRILHDNGIIIDTNALKHSFDHYCYHETSLQNDLCDIMLNHSEDNILLAQMLINDLKYTNESQRKLIYDILLYKYVKKQDLNNNNFSKILQMTASRLYPNIDIHKMQIIVRIHNLSGQIFIKTSSEFKNAIQFSKLFKTMDNWKKKKWQKVYMSINKWTSTKFKTEKKKNIKKSDIKTESVHYCKEELDKKETKYTIENEIDHINVGTDHHMVQTFCAMTHTDKETAILFLAKSKWNTMFAIDEFYSHRGKMCKIAGNHDNVAVDDANATVYSHGIAFWYWRFDSGNRRYIKAKYDNLKLELMQFKQFSLSNWQQLHDECNIMLKTDKIKTISGNGNHEEIYDIKTGDCITMEHLLSIKLYTDFSWLCTIFCKCFRLTKISSNQYERIQSLERRNEKVANMARYLIESVRCYGQRLRNKKTKYYRGIETKFIFKQFISRFHVPLSTTIDLSIAIGFADGSNGLVMELRRHHRFLFALNCSIFSAFDHEKEYLFFGGNTIFQISTVFQWHENKWLSYRNYIKGIQALLNIAHGTMQWTKYGSNIINSLKDIIGYILPDLYVDHVPLPQYIVSLLCYHLNHLPDMIEYDLTKLPHNYDWVQHMFVKDKQIPNIFNSCNLFRNCRYISIIMPSDNVINMDCCTSIKGDLLKLAANNIRIEFRWTAAVSLYEIQSLFLETNVKSDKIILETYINHQRNSLTIVPTRIGHQDCFNDMDKLLVMEANEVLHKRLVMAIAPTLNPCIIYTLTHWILLEQQKGDLSIILNSIASVCKKISSTAKGAAIYSLCKYESRAVKKLDAFSNDSMITALTGSGEVSLLVSGAIEREVLLVGDCVDPKYCAVFDALNGLSNIDANVSVGTIFGILKVKSKHGNLVNIDLLQKGEELICAGYVMYGPATLLVLTFGEEVNGFTLNPQIGEFILTHRNIKIPHKGKIYSVNEGNSHGWDPVIRHYIGKCKDPKIGKPKKARYTGSMVADVHRILLYGGIFLYPATKRRRNGKLCLLYELNPMAFIIHAAGGKSSTGYGSILSIPPDHIHCRAPCILGSKYDVDEIEQMYKKQYLQSKKLKK
eukprot:372524_1